MNNLFSCGGCPVSAIIAIAAAVAFGFGVAKAPVVPVYLACCFVLGVVSAVGLIGIKAESKQRKQNLIKAGAVAILWGSPFMFFGDATKRFFTVQQQEQFGWMLELQGFPVLMLGYFVAFWYLGTRARRTTTIEKKLKGASTRTPQLENQNFMKAVIQRCTGARVEVDGKVVGEIGRGLTVFLGVFEGDDENAAAKMARKIAALRIFDDENGRFDFSLAQSGGGVLAIPNFTLCGDAKKGARPNFSAAAKPEIARPLFQTFVTLLRLENVPVETGVFGAQMKVVVENDGPVTLITET